MGNRGIVNEDQHFKHFESQICLDKYQVYYNNSVWFFVNNIILTVKTEQSNAKAQIAVGFSFLRWALINNLDSSFVINFATRSYTEKFVAAL